MRRRLGYWLLGCIDCQRLIWRKGHPSIHAACKHRRRQKEWDQAHGWYGDLVHAENFTCSDCGWVPS